MPPTHPNRSKRSDAPGRTPKPDEIRAAREASQLSRAEAAALVHASIRGWEKWENGERRMHPGLWELFNLKRTARETASDCSQTRETKHD